MQDLKEPLHQGLRGAVHPVKGLVNPSWHLRSHELLSLLGVPWQRLLRLCPVLTLEPARKPSVHSFPHVRPCSVRHLISLTERCFSLLGIIILMRSEKRVIDKRHLGKMGRSRGQSLFHKEWKESVL